LKQAGMKSLFGYLLFSASDLESFFTCDTYNPWTYIFTSDTFRPWPRDGKAFTFSALGLGNTSLSIDDIRLPGAIRVTIWSMPRRRVSRWTS